MYYMYLHVYLSELKCLICSSFFIFFPSSRTATPPGWTHRTSSLRRSCVLFRLRPRGTSSLDNDTGWNGSMVPFSPFEKGNFNDDVISYKCTHIYIYVYIIYIYTCDVICNFHEFSWCRWFVFWGILARSVWKSLVYSSLFPEVDHGKISRKHPCLMEFDGKH